MWNHFAKSAHLDTFGPKMSLLHVHIHADSTINIPQGRNKIQKTNTEEESHHETYV